MRDCMAFHTRRLKICVRKSNAPEPKASSDSDDRTVRGNGAIVTLIMVEDGGDVDAEDCLAKRLVRMIGRRMVN